MRILTPWTQQPQVPVEIDWANPITRGLVTAYVAGNPVDAVRGSKFTNTSLYGGTANGRAGYATSPSTYTRSTNDPVTLFVVGSFYSSTDWNPKLYESSTWSSSSVNAGIEVFRDHSSPNHLKVGAYKNNNNNFSAGFSPTFGRVYATCFGYDGTNYYLDVDGVNKSSGALADGVLNAGVVETHGTSAYGVAPVILSLRWNRALNSAERKSLSANPWQIFKPIPRYIFAPVSAATGDGTGIGSLYAITLTSPTATAAGTANATATGSLAASTLTAPTGSASAGTSATATGAFAASSLSAPSATATGSALATGALTTVTLTTITASANGSALATGTIDQIDLSTVAGNATGTTAGNAEGVGSVATIALSAPVATALGTALATGNFASIGLGTVSGSASAATDGQAAASIQPISISAPLAIAIASSVATGGIQSIGLTAPTGTASGQTQTIARPTSDISNTGWTPSTGSDLYAMLDEVSPDDADYISTSSVGAVCKFGMNATAFPGGASQQLSLRASSSTGNGILVTIKDGATVIATRSLTLTPTFDLHTITLTSGEIAAITSGNLTVEMTST